MDHFALEEEQAQYVLNMKLRSISNADEEKVENELSELYERLPKLLDIVNNDKTTMQTLKDELEEIKNKFGDDRRTIIDIQTNSSINEEDLIVDEDLVITITSDGNIKSVAASAYNVQNRGGKGSKGANTKDDEIVVDLFSVKSKDDILFITNTGRCHVLKAYKIPKVARSAKGKNIVNYLKLDEGEYPVSTIATNVAENQDATLVLATKFGMIKRLKLSMLSSKYSFTKVAKLKEGDEFVKALIGTDDDEILMVSENGMYTRFPLNSVRPSGKSAIGVIGMKFKTIDDCLLTMSIIKDSDDLIIVSELGIGKRTNAEEYKASKNKGGKGFQIYKANHRTGKVAACITVIDENLLITTANGTVIRLDSTKISKLSKNAMGSKLINLDENDKVSSVAKIVADEEEGDLNE
jgi:DNA gyrase subunit A